MALHPRGLGEGFAGIILAAGVVLMFAPLAARAQCIVTDTSDDVSDTGSLRYCVAQANAAASAYTITFASSLNGGTITLTGGPLPFTSSFPVTIQGPGAKLLTISSGGESPLFSVGYPPTSPSVTISGLTMANWYVRAIGNGGLLEVDNCTIYGTPEAADAIENFGTLRLTNSIISGNPGPAIDDYGTTFVGNSTITGNSEGIYADGTLTVYNSTISGNTTAPGIGIYMYWDSAVYVINSTISGNAGSGISTDTYHCQYCQLTVNNSSISGNADSGLYLPTIAFLNMNNSTISGNTGSAGGGIYNNSPLIFLMNSIVAGNTSSESPGEDCNYCPPQSPYNLISTSAAPVNPDLEALANFGGPTQSMLPLPGSPAICAGSPSLVPTGLNTDQRGFPRLNTSYTGYSTDTPCVDLGAVQTNYQSVQFPTPDAAYSGAAGGVISDPAYPVVSVIENGQNVGGVPVTLAISGSPNVGGVWTETTVSNSGATFNDLIVNSAGDYALSATLGITPTVTISTANSTNGNATLAITGTATNTAITSHTPNPSVVGQGVTVSFTVTPVLPSGQTPTGTVSVSDGTGDSCTGRPSATPVSCRLVITAAGSKTLTATYSGDANFGGSSGTASQTVNPAQTTTRITSHTPTTAVAGQPVTIAFTVSALPPGAGRPTGNVTVTDGAGDSCTAPVAAGNCSIAIPYPGTWPLIATYAGDGNYGPGASAAVTQSVVDFAITAGPQAKRVSAGGTTFFTVTLTPQGGFTGVISLSCGQVPPDSTCEVRPNSVSLTGVDSVTALAWITTGRPTPLGNHTLVLTGTYGSGNSVTGGLKHSAEVTLDVY